MIHEVVSPDEAVLWGKPFVYRPCVAGVARQTALLLEWVKPPRPRSGDYGATGSVRLLQAEPASAPEGPVWGNISDTRLQEASMHPRELAPL